MVQAKTKTETVKEFAQTVLRMCNGCVDIGRVQGPYGLYWEVRGDIYIGSRRGCGRSGGITTGLWVEPRHSHIAGLNLGYWWAQSLSEQQREIIQKLGNTLIHEDYELSLKAETCITE